MALDDKLARELLPRVKRLCEQHNWNIRDHLGSGASAAVFEVESEGPKLHALKVFAPRFLKGRTGVLVRKRFDLMLRELHDHDCPHLVKIEKGGEIDGTLFLLMQRIPGEQLGNVLKQIPPGNVREIIRQIAVAAKYLEDKKLCHRDIKSDNVVISEDFKSAVLTDLGVLRWLDEEGAAGTDQEGQLPFVATARYSSPEYMFRCPN
jgi:serine/threonine-protein kinase